MKKIVLLAVLVVYYHQGFCWGFYGHKHINYHAVFLLPPEMMIFFKKNIDFLSEHAVDPDKRRYSFAPEAPRHYIDIDRYGKYPYDSLPRKWNEAVAKFSEDTLVSHGIGPWWIQTMLYRLTKAFGDKDKTRILRLSAELGHYIADLHVPLHTSSNHNGQFTGQKGIHGFWESRIPELLAEKNWDFFIGRANYISDPLQFTWARVMESAAASDSVLRMERSLSQKFPADQKFAFEERNGVIIRQYSTVYTLAYDKMLNNMVERRMRQSIYATASLWYTAWVNAGQPDLKDLSEKSFDEQDLKEFDELNRDWKNGKLAGRDCGGQ
jgi:hypothetical protein